MSFCQLFLGCNRAVGDMATFDDWRAFAEATSQQPTHSRTSQSHSSKRSQTQVRSRTCPVSIGLRGPPVPHMRPLHSQAGRTIITITVTYDATFTSISILSRTRFKSRLCHAHLSSYNHAKASVHTMNRMSKTQNDPHWKKIPKKNETDGKTAQQSINESFAADCDERSAIQHRHTAKPGDATMQETSSSVSSATQLWNANLTTQILVVSGQVDHVHVQQPCDSVHSDRQAADKRHTRRVVSSSHLDVRRVAIPCPRRSLQTEKN